MSDRLTPDDLAAIRERVEAATDGPWWAAREGLIYGKDRHHEGYAEEVASTTPANAEFIAHARDDVPALLAEVERLTAERDAARAEVAALEGRIRGLADGVDPDWRREHEGLVTPADLRALLAATPSETEEGR